MSIVLWINSAFTHSLCVFVTFSSLFWLAPLLRQNRVFFELVVLKCENTLLADRCKAIMRQCQSNKYLHHFLSPVSQCVSCLGFCSCLFQMNSASCPLVFDTEAHPLSQTQNALTDQSGPHPFAWTLCHVYDEKSSVVYLTCMMTPWINHPPCSCKSWRMSPEDCPVGASLCRSLVLHHFHVHLQIWSRDDPGVCCSSSDGLLSSH